MLISPDNEIRLPLVQSSPHNSSVSGPIGLARQRSVASPAFRYCGDIATMEKRFDGQVAVITGQQGLSCAPGHISVSFCLLVQPPRSQDC